MCGYIRSRCIVSLCDDIDHRVVNRSDLDERSRWVGIDGFIENIAGGNVGLMASCIVLFATTLR